MKKTDNTARQDSAENAVLELDSQVTRNNHGDSTTRTRQKNRVTRD